MKLKKKEVSFAEELTELIRKHDDGTDEKHMEFVAMLDGFKHRIHEKKFKGEPL